MLATQKFFKESSYWVKLALLANRHIKRSLIRVLHNDINDSTVSGCPSDPNDLFTFFQQNKNIIQNSRHIKTEQKLILLPTTSQSVDSSSFDISLIRWLIQTFCHIKNANGKWDKPNASDTTICAFVYRAANIRNTIFHYNNVDALDEVTFEQMWKEIEYILTGLRYGEDIKPIKTVEFLDPAELQGEILQEFRDHLESYKSECSTKSSDDFYIQRRFYENENEHVFTKIDEIIKENRRVIIYGDAGIGKSTTSRHIKSDWSKEVILDEFHLLYFNSKQINQRIQYHSYAAPLFFSELGDHLARKGKTERNFVYYDCVTTTIDNLIILIDGVDEFPINDLVTEHYIDELEMKVKNNEKISAADTINAIYFGFFLPYSKVCLLGRTVEFERLKNFKVKTGPAIFNEQNCKIKDLQLLRLDDADVKDFTCFKLCKQQLNGQRICTGNCKEIHEKIKAIELCKIPTDLNSLIELHKKHPNENIGRITRTKLMITTLLNRLNEHTKQKKYFPCKTFEDIPEHNKKFIECFRILGEISFNTLYKRYITVKVNKETINGIVYFNHQNQIKIERNVLEELDFFYVRDADYYFILEPHHTLNIEFLSSCFLFSHPEKWSSIPELSKNRQLVIISFIAGLHTDDYFTKDFVNNVLNTSDSSIEKFFHCLHDKEIRKNLPDGGLSYAGWYGLIENQEISLSFYLLDSISKEVEIPQNFIPQKTILYYCENPSFKWYDMKYCKHNFLTNSSKSLNIESFLSKFPMYNLIIKGDIQIRKYNELERLHKCKMSGRVTFRIRNLIINRSLDLDFISSFNVISLHLGGRYISDTTTILNAISPPTTSSTIAKIKCKYLNFYDIQQYNFQQSERIFTIGLSEIVDYITLRSTFLTDNQIDNLKDVERRHTDKLISINLCQVKFNHLFHLPNLGRRHLSLSFVEDVNEYYLNKLREYILPSCNHNFFNYKIIDPQVPFVRKTLQSQEQSMYLVLTGVYFRDVSPDVFAKTFSLIPSLAFSDHSFFIPSTHWLRLAQTENCQINEMRIWHPQSKNFENLLNIKTKNMQFIFSEKDKLKELLNHVVNNPTVQLNKEIKVFVVKFDDYNWDYYEEITLFSGEKIEEYKNKYTSNNSLLDNICIPFYEGEQHVKFWCCEFFQSENIGLWGEMSSYIKKTWLGKRKLSKTN